jgi:hypothetical protein
MAEAEAVFTAAVLTWRAAAVAPTSRAAVAVLALRAAVLEAAEVAAGLDRE